MKPSVREATQEIGILLEQVMKHPSQAQGGKWVDYRIVEQQEAERIRQDICCTY